MGQEFRPEPFPTTIPSPEQALPRPRRGLPPHAPLARRRGAPRTYRDRPDTPRPAAHIRRRWPQAPAVTRAPAGPAPARAAAEPHTTAPRRPHSAGHPHPRPPPPADLATLPGAYAATAPPTPPAAAAYPGSMTAGRCGSRSRAPGAATAGRVLPEISDTDSPPVVFVVTVTLAGSARERAVKRMAADGRLGWWPSISTWSRPAGRRAELSVRGGEVPGNRTRRC